MRVPPHLPRPRATMARVSVSEPHGQVEDWVAPLPGGSRVHVWVMPGGQMLAHRDAFDPGLGALPAAAHVVRETRLGRAAAAVAALGAVFAVFRALR